MTPKYFIPGDTHPSDASDPVTKIFLNELSIVVHSKLRTIPKQQDILSTCYLKQTAICQLLLPGYGHQQYTITVRAVCNTAFTLAARSVIVSIIF